MISFISGALSCSYCTYCCALQYLHSLLKKTAKEAGEMSANRLDPIPESRVP